MVGIWNTFFSFWDGLFSGAIFILGSVATWQSTCCMLEKSPTSADNTRTWQKIISIQVQRLVFGFTTAAIPLFNALLSQSAFFGAIKRGHSPLIPALTVLSHVARPLHLFLLASSLRKHTQKELGRCFFLTFVLTISEVVQDLSTDWTNGWRSYPEHQQLQQLPSNK